jgi:predicted transcriptional regulator
MSISYLKNVMKDWPTNILSNEHLHVRCCAHIINLIQNTIKFVRSPPSRQLAFKKCRKVAYRV